MPSAMLATVARRGFEVHARFSEMNPKYQLPTWGVVMLVCTAAIFFFFQFMVEYTFGRIIPTLLMIETPQEAILFEPLPQTDENDNTVKDPDVVALKQPYLTSSFRATLRHLTSKGGFWARFRGFSIFAANTFLVQFVANLIPGLQGFAPVLAAVACAQLSLTWTHIVISDPSPTRWFRRVPTSYKTWKKVAAPTAILAVAEQLTVLLPIGLAAIYGIDLRDPNSAANLSDGEKKLLALKGISILALAIVLGLLIVLPANVTLTRVQASLLPDTDESIVPFDRSFGGKVEPEIVGGSGVIGILDAWKTFDWNSRIRLVKAYLKVFVMQMVLTILFTVTIVCELFIIVGKDWSKLAPQEPENGGQN